MAITKLISQRYSVRAYLPNEIEEEKLQLVLNSARLAPTAANRQPFKLLIITTKGRKEELRKIYNRDWFTQAPIIIAAIGLPKKAWTRHDGQKYTLVDVAIAMDHLILTATELGLGTCWIAAFNPEAAKEVLRLPDDAVPVVFSPLGYAADKPKPKERKPLSELVRYEYW